MLTVCGILTIWLQTFKNTHAHNVQDFDYKCFLVMSFEKEKKKGENTCEKEGEIHINIEIKRSLSL